MGREIDVGLPIKPFLYTLDQIADLLVIQLHILRRDYIYFYGLSTGGMQKDRLVARNIAPDGQPKEWRVTENELKRWLKFRGFRVYDRSSVRV